MDSNLKIGLIVGSLRKASNNRKIAENLIRLAPQHLELEIIEIGNLPLYNEDIDQDTPPESYQEFRATLAACDGFIFVTPEYNRSMPAAIKNALDVGSRPARESHWRKKPSAVVSSSPGAYGGFGAHQQVRQTLVSLDIPCLPKPEIYLSGINAQSFNEQGQIIEERTEQFLGSFLKEYEQWINQLIK